MSLNAHMNTVCAGLNLIYANVALEKNKASEANTKFSMYLDLSNKEIPDMLKRTAKAAVVALAAIAILYTVPALLAFSTKLVSTTACLAGGLFAVIATFNGSIDPVTENGRADILAIVKGFINTRLEDS